MLTTARERLQRLVAGAVAELVVEALEVVDVEQADRELAAAALEARALDLEGLHQAAPVGDLRQLVGRDLVGEAPHLVLELDHALRQVGRLAVLLLQARLRLLRPASARRGFRSTISRTTPVRLSSESASSITSA